MSDLQETILPDAAAVATTPGSTPTAIEDSSTTATLAISSTKPSEHATPRPSSLPKPSGLKPPTKIGRLCSNSAPKPAVPISPRTDGSTSDSVRKLSDELSRKHLSDLIEAEEDEVSSSLPDKPRPYRKASTSSTYSVTSMDALWEKHARRLSEAGLRRSSDHSVVLTEDTDSFIIGERVWVGGTKPGQIAYIGETQFAPGDWAGIVLDEPIGKNDGSVAGTRYFQCAEKRGVFSRLTRLTRIPLVTHAPHDASPASDAGSVFERPPSGASRQRRTLSPNGSVRSVVSSKMNASVSTTNTGELRLGDRVIVSSSRGSKAGTLRYVGITDFAPGIWAGVELDDPLGKNDGSVDSKRYFECAPRFGLFAPIAKVSRSPSNRKPGACAIHSNGRATPMRRSNSRESLTSLGTSIASSRAGVRLGVTSLGAQRMGGPRASSTPVSAKNALQELLREKQHHLERLMRERELERTEVAKASLQADRAESALAQLKKEASQANIENEKLKAELDKLNKQLEDERQKVEDLMFRSEEENINKEDYNKYKEAMEQEKTTREQRIRELEAEAVLQSARAEATAAQLRALEDQRAAETAALAEQHKEELTAAHTLSSELQKLLDEAYALLKEKECEKDSLGKSMSDELSKVKMESDKALNEAKTKIAIAQTEFETQISVITAKLQLAESKLETEKQNLERLNKENSQTISDLNGKLAQMQAAVDDKTLELNKVLGSSKEHELNLNKEITKLKMELSAKVLDLEQLEDTKIKQETAFRNLLEEVAKVKEESSSKINEYESLLNEMSQQNEKSKTEIMELQQNLLAKTKEYEKLLTDSSSSSSSTEKLVTEYKQTIHERDKEIIKLKDEFEQVTANFNIKHSKIAEEHKKEIEDRNTKIEQLMKEIETHKQALDQSKIEFDTLNSQLLVNVDELKALNEENGRLKQAINELTQTINDLKSKIASMELDFGELKRHLNSTTEKCDELQKAKEKIESEYMHITGQATDSNEQFNQLSQHLKDTEKELQKLKDKHREAVNNHGRIEQELKQKLFKLQEDFAEERGQLVQSVDQNIEKLTVADSRIKELETHSAELQKKWKELGNNNDKLLDENSTLKKEIETLKLKEQELNTEYESKRKKLEVNIQRYKEEIGILKAEGATSEVKLMEKVDQLTEAQNDLNNKLEEARKHEDSLQKVLDDTTSQMNNRKSQYENDISELQSQLIATREESNYHKTEEFKLKEMLQEKHNNIKDLTLKLEILKVDLTVLTQDKSTLDTKLAEVTSELQMWAEKYKSADEKVKETITTNQSLQKALTEKDNLLQSLNEKTQVESNKTKHLEREIAQLKQEISNKDSAIKEKESQLMTLSNSLQSGSQEAQQLIAKFQTENTQLHEKLKNEVESLNNTIKTLRTRVAEQEKQLTELQQSKDKVVELQELLAKSERDIKQLTDINDGQKSNYEDLNKQLQTQFDEYKRDSKRSKHDLKAKLEEYQKELKESKEKVKGEIEKQGQLQQKLTEAENNLVELAQKLELITVQQSANLENNNVLEKLTMELQATRKSSAEAIANSEAMINNLKVDIQHKIKDLELKDDLICKLQEEVKKQKAKVELADREKVMLQKEFAEKNKNLKDKNDNNSMGVLGQGDTAPEMVDNKELDGQVNFLNSVIVDMQRKNEQLMARVQALESGSVTSDSPVFNGRKVRAVAPRLFCDICDIFDAHDTEDCPRQAADADAPAPPANPNRKPPPPPRPYCDICEVFGHATEDCDEEETF
ncbi:CAP-Gly domain-containing linker protein 1 isoform X6 [Hyposmocoma kahamanoa]|uniref:CAP-Gly domain-containing linker protein 1 isoform X6 n=1 Tax=Hyposmocoma kahamanoa TaxID=1477025 RepID=UPI000E6D626A|nr:CAP-Gly domain-containing linker protein 1 isoform X6 [Hyposmocoma kahamanoa]